MTKYKDYSILDALKKGLSTRLLDLLSKKGYKNNRKPYYVDTLKFAEELDVSGTMLRRYLSGDKLPTLDIVQKAAKQLNVDPLWLYSGYEVSSIDVDLLKKIIKRMLPILITSSKLQKELDANIEYLAEIYEHISMIKTPDEIEKNKLIGWMLGQLLEAHRIQEDKLKGTKREQN